jgi:hypothetical protein
MNTFLLLAGTLLTPVASCEQTKLTCCITSRTQVVAALHADKNPAKQPAPSSPTTPAKKTAPKERDRRPAPPGHWFM